jgi:hypothetical protein
MGPVSVVRATAFVVGALLVIGGFGAIAIGGDFALGGLWAVLSGGFLMIVAVLERNRYRSEAAEESNDPAGVGGGETEPLEARFRPTEEVFVDPTSGRRMRVLIDPRTGERRYVAEA